MDKELEELIDECDLETLEEALQIAKLHWAIDFQPRNYGFYPAEERRFNEWVEAQQGKPWGLEDE